MKTLNHTSEQNNNAMSNNAANINKFIREGVEVIEKENNNFEITVFHFVANLILLEISINESNQIKDVMRYEKFAELCCEEKVNCKLVAKTTFVNARGAVLKFYALIGRKNTQSLLQKIGRNQSDIIRKSLKPFRKKDKITMLNNLLALPEILHGKTLQSQIDDIAKQKNLAVKTPSPTKNGIKKEVSEEKRIQNKIGSFFKKVGKSNVIKNIGVEAIINEIGVDAIIEKIGIENLNAALGKSNFVIIKKSDNLERKEVLASDKSQKPESATLNFPEQNSLSLAQNQTRIEQNPPIFEQKAPSLNPQKTNIVQPANPTPPTATLKHQNESVNEKEILTIQMAQEGKDFSTIQKSVSTILSRCLKTEDERRLHNGKNSVIASLILKGLCDPKKLLDVKSRADLENIFGPLDKLNKDTFPNRNS